MNITPEQFDILLKSNAKVSQLKMNAYLEEEDTSVSRNEGQVEGKRRSFGNVSSNISSQVIRVLIRQTGQHQAQQNRE